MHVHMHVHMYIGHAHVYMPSIVVSFFNGIYFELSVDSYISFTQILLGCFIGPVFTKR